MGNPLNYTGSLINGITVEGSLEWNGRQLSAVVIDGKRYEYSYDSDGMRTSVKVYEDNTLKNVYYYIWENGKIIGYYISNGTGTSVGFIKMVYDGEGEPVGFEFKDSASDEIYYFYFRKNLQGDITAVCNSNQQELITYTYDAWGGVQLQSMNENTFESLYAFICTPITYRGYNYDAFTGLYYLQSRYYNAAYGRFLNADTTEILEATQGTPLGANLFAYCNNNPVNYVDYEGMSVTAIIIAFITLLVVGILDNIFGTKKFQEAIINFKFKLVLRNHPGLSKLFDSFNAVSEILSINNEYWGVYMLFAAHAKNIIDYGKGYNATPYYPSYDIVCGSNATDYKTRCQNAYKTAIEWNLIDRNTKWSAMTPEEQYVFVHEMMFYDNSMYHDLLLFSLKKMGRWGTEELAGFLFGFMDILCDAIC